MIVNTTSKAITREELSRHCRRRTHGEVEIHQLMEQLTLNMTGRSDSGGIFNDRIATTWEEEKKHIACIQDPEGVTLYTITGHIIKSEIKLPVLRFTRGTTSLESFHLHLARYLILVLFCGRFLTTATQHPLLDSSQALLQVMYTIKHTCWRGSLDGTRPEHWQRPSIKIASYELSICSWPTRVVDNVYF